MNFLLRERKLRAKTQAHHVYHSFRSTIATAAWLTVIAGVLAWVMERVKIMTSAQDTLTWLAYLYNPLMMAGTAFASAIAFHNFSMRNHEVRRIKAINAEIDEIHIQKLDLMNSQKTEDYYDGKKPSNAESISPIAGYRKPNGTPHGVNAGGRPVGKNIDRRN